MAKPRETYDSATLYFEVTFSSTSAISIQFFLCCLASLLTKRSLA